MMKRLKINRKILKGLATNAVMALGIIVYASPVFANDINSLKLFTGTSALITAVVGGLTALVGAAGSYFALKAGYAWHAAEPDEAPRKKKELIRTIIVSIVLTCIPSALAWVLGFYK